MAVDAFDGELAVVVEGTVDPGILGLTGIRYVATDTSGNQASLERFVTVVADVTPPEVLAPEDLVIEASAALTPVERGEAVVVDDTEPTIAAVPDTPGPFAVGQCTITWTATDPSGNVGTDSQQLTVTDTAPPALTLIGAAHVIVEVGEAFVDPGVEAVDLVDGDLSDAVVVTGGVDTSSVGQTGRGELVVLRCGAFWMRGIREGEPTESTPACTRATVPRCVLPSWPSPCS